MNSLIAHDSDVQMRLTMYLSVRLKVTT